MPEELRTSTDVLLSIEDKIIQLLKFIQNQDNNIKILMNRLSEIENTIKLSAASQLSQSVVPVIKRTVGSVKPVDEPPQAIISNVDKPKIKKQEKKVEKQPTGSVNVTQVIQYPDGKRALFALVEIYNSNNELIEKTKTNTGGRWTKTLIPGQYKIQVSKPSPLLQLEYFITVDNSNSTQELSSPDFK